MGTPGRAHQRAAKRRRGLEPGEGDGERRLGDRAGAVCPGARGNKSDEPVIGRATAYLIKTQRDDGSWPMTSRPVKPGGEGAKSLIPITGAGSAWAVLGLVRSR